MCKMKRIKTKIEIKKEEKKLRKQMFLDLNPRPQNPTEIGAAALTHSVMMSQNYQEVD